MKRASVADMTLMHGTPGLLALALLLAACSDDGQNTSFSSQTETGPGPTTVTPTTTATPTTGGTEPVDPTTSGSSTGGTTMSVLTSSTGDTSTSEPGTTGPAPCAEDTIVCEAGSAKVCDGAGGFKSEEACPDACVDGVGCKPCAPDTFQCIDDLSQKCNQDYEWVDYESCDPVQGVNCDANTGACIGSCSRADLGTSYIGCDYFPATLANLHETQPWVFNYSIVVANTTGDPADITITKGDAILQMAKIGPGTAQVINLPYVDALVKPTIAENGPSVLVVDGAYRLRSTQPVTVYQYEPIDYEIGGVFSFTNDASLLLPTHIWTGNYRVASRNHWNINGSFLPGFYAVVAKDDDTTVTVTPSSTGASVYAGAGIKANGTGEIKLNAGDVLEVFTKSTGQIPDSDLTGTLVTANKPVSVFGGHKCVQVPLGTQACDRLEEAMLPIETLAKEYIVTPPLIPTGGNQPKAQYIRVIATEDATTISYEPPQNGAPTMIATAGEWFEIPANTTDFRITGDKKILVAQYMQGQGNDSSGDPAMTLAVATEQFRLSYLVHAPLSYETNFANIVAPSDAKITLDGQPVNGFQPIGTTGYSVMRVQLAKNADGNHDLSGDKAFGVTVYGYGQYTSYWYPGGLDLDLIPG